MRIHKKNLLAKVSALPLLVILLAAPAFPLKLRVSASAKYHRVTDSLVREIYGNGGLLIGGSLSLDLSRYFEFRAEVSRVRLQGKMSLTKEDLALTMFPMVFEVRFRTGSSKFSPYFGWGFVYTPYKETYPARIGDFSDAQAGIEIETGAYFSLGSHLFVDVNLRYDFTTAAQLFGEKIRLGGTQLGIGLGYIF